MHIEKTICESVLGTLPTMAGKSKDSEKARLDMEELGMRKDQHPLVKNDMYTFASCIVLFGSRRQVIFMQISSRCEGARWLCL